MDDVFVNAVKKTCDTLYLETANPNPELLKEALSLDAADIDTLSLSLVQKYLIVLGQYLITLKFAENLKCAAYNDLKRVHEHKLNSKAVNSKTLYPGITFKTSKEKTAYIIETDSDMMELETKVRKAKAEYKLVENMVEPVQEYIQVLKRSYKTNDKY